MIPPDHHRPPSRIETANRAALLIVALIAVLVLGALVGWNAILRTGASGDPSAPAWRMPLRADGTTWLAHDPRWVALDEDYALYLTLDLTRARGGQAARVRITPPVLRQLCGAVLTALPAFDPPPGTKAPPRRRDLYRLGFRFRKDSGEMTQVIPVGVSDGACDESAGWRYPGALAGWALIDIVMQPHGGAEYPVARFKQPGPTAEVSGARLAEACAALLADPHPDLVPLLEDGGQLRVEAGRAISLLGVYAGRWLGEDFLISGTACILQEPQTKT